MRIKGNGTSLRMVVGEPWADDRTPLGFKRRTGISCDEIRRRLDVPLSNFIHIDTRGRNATWGV